ncbi:MAG: diaminopimelate epimerase [Bacteroidota bacterium]|jgi:diaminopimelate epimerase
MKMDIYFEKYQGAGNDFIMIDNRSGEFISHQQDLIANMCNRHMGIGADGLIELVSTQGEVPRMIYYNADGREGSLCGNGARCFSLFAKRLGLLEEQRAFEASDGIHDVMFLPDGEISIAFKEPKIIEAGDDHFVIDTGSPHYVKWVDNLSLDVFSEGRKIRYNESYQAKGINVNFALIRNDEIHLRTYERGVENETLACGTGVVAAAIAAFLSGKIKINRMRVMAKGGVLHVSFKHKKSSFTDVWLTGPAKKVFSGIYFFDFKT